MSGMDTTVRIQILSVPDCPLVGRVRQLVEQALARINVQAEMVERVGEYSSPTLLIDGRDVTGRPWSPGSACRLDPPTEQQVLAALERVVGRLHGR